jgi:hypothetical protein
MQSENRPSVPWEITTVISSIQGLPSTETRDKLIALINILINKDFHGLVQLLYRIDVNEKKIKGCLQQNVNKDSASVIADLIIERQLQKIESRKQFRGNKNQENDEEKW